MRQMTVVSINHIPQAVSAVFIGIPIPTFILRNSDSCSVFKSELIAIKRRLRYVDNTKKRNLVFYFQHICNISTYL